MYLHVYCHWITLKLCFPIIAFTVFVSRLLLIAHHTVVSASLMCVSLPCRSRSRCVCSRSTSCSVTVDRTAQTTSARSFGPVRLSPRRNAVVVVVSKVKSFNEMKSAVLCASVYYWSDTSAIAFNLLDIRDVSRTVATCGGETLCVIDCESGHVLKKYKVPGEVSAKKFCTIPSLSTGWLWCWPISFLNHINETWYTMAIQTIISQFCCLHYTVCACAQYANIPYALNTWVQFSIQKSRLWEIFFPQCIAHNLMVHL